MESYLNSVKQLKGINKKNRDFKECYFGIEKKVLQEFVHSFFAITSLSKISFGNYILFDP